MRAGFLQVCGGQVETGWWGPGPDEAATLVLLHEGLGSVALWRDVPERLAAATGCGVFAYSRFGYGYSEGVTLPRPMTYMQDEALLLLPEVLKAAGIRRAVLVGHSDGGSIAAVYAGSFTSKVVGGRADPHSRARSPGYDTEGEAAGGVRLLGLVMIAAHFVVEDLNIASIRKIKREYEDGGLRRRLARYHRDVDVAFRGWNDAWLDPAFRDFDITGFLPHIRAPVLALQGAADPYGSDVQLRVLDANVRVPVTIRVIEGARHSPHLEAMDVTLAAISDFVAGCLT